MITASAAELTKSTGQKCIGLSADVRNPQALATAVAAGVAAFGGIDYVVAGAAGEFPRFLMIEKWVFD